MALRLSNKIIVVTGGTQGVGEGIAQHAAESGAAGIVITGRDAARGARVVAGLETLGASACFVAADLAKADAGKRVIGAAVDRFGRVDGLVNAAGVTTRGRIDDTTPELWDLIFAVNTRAPFLLSQEMVRVQRAARMPGSIVNVITMSSHGGQPFLVPYSASKGALATLTKNLAHGLRRDRIRCNGINLGWTDTPGEHEVQRAEGKAGDWLSRAEASQPFGRLLRPRDVGYLATYLLSDESEMMTGALIDLDQNVMGAYD